MHPAHPKDMALFLRSTLGIIRANGPNADPTSSARLWEGNVRVALHTDPARALATLEAIGPLEFVDYTHPYADLIDFTACTTRTWPWAIPGVSAHIQARILSIGKTRAL